MLIFSIVTANGLSYVISINYTNMMWYTFQVDPACCLSINSAMEQNAANFMIHLHHKQPQCHTLQCLLAHDKPVDAAK